MNLFLFSIILISTLVLGVIDKNIPTVNPLMASTLDSLQGIWVSTADSNWMFKVNGRILDNIIFDGFSLYHDYNKLYFSDTIINDSVEKYKDLHIDTSNLSGKYLIEVTVKDSLVSCYRIEGFFSNGKVLGLYPTWTSKSPNVFKKTNIIPYKIYIDDNNH